MSQLKLINYRSGFSLLEVVISLLIISVTFLAYGQLIEQNLRAQDLKQNFIDDHQLKTNVLTIHKQILTRSQHTIHSAVSTLF